MIDRSEQCVTYLRGNNTTTDTMNDLCTFASEKAGGQQQTHTHTETNAYTSTANNY